MIHQPAQNLRQYFHGQLGKDYPDLPLSLLIRKCYGEFIANVNNGQKGTIPPSQTGKKLESIAQHYVLEIRNNKKIF